MEREKITIYTMRKVDDQWTVFYVYINFVVMYIHIHTTLYFISFRSFRVDVDGKQKEVSEWLFYITIFFYHVGCLSVFTAE